MKRRKENCQSKAGCSGNFIVFLATVSRNSILSSIRKKKKKMKLPHTVKASHDTLLLYKGNGESNSDAALANALLHWLFLKENFDCVALAIGCRS